MLSAKSRDESPLSLCVHRTPEFLQLTAKPEASVIWFVFTFPISCLAPKVGGVLAVVAVVAVVATISESPMVPEIKSAGTSRSSSPSRVGRKRGRAERPRTGRWVVLPRNNSRDSRNMLVISFDKSTTK